MNLSVTSKTPDALSPIFAENIGQDDTVVFGRGAITVEVFARTSPSQATTFNVFFERPFYYNPSNGNLLLDVRNYAGASLLFAQEVGKPALDAVNQSGDGVSRVYANSVSATTADASDTSGLVTRFYFDIIPEPSCITLLVVGGATLLLVQRRLHPVCKTIGSEQSPLVNTNTHPE